MKNIDIEKHPDLDKIHSFRETLRSLRGEAQPPPDIETALNEEDAGFELDSQAETQRLRDEEEIKAVRESLGLRAEKIQQKDGESGAKVEIEQSAEKELERLLSDVFEGRNLEQATANFSQEVWTFISGKVREQFSPKTIETLDSLYRNEKFISEAVGRMKAGATTELAKVLLGVFGKFKEHVPLDYFQEAMGQLGAEQKPGSSGLKTMASMGFDFIPVLGPGKMLIEAKNGKTLDGAKLEGWKRALHALEGGAFLILDLTGVGAIGTKAAKGSVLGAKIFTRSAAMARKIGLGREIYTPLFKTGKAITRNKTLAKVVDRTFDQFITKRRFYGRSNARRAG